ncbi:MAG: FAD-dependent oxidoreductase [Lachnospiraceae bacterium]|nr:FAD-dependent oxidoreductase [Lachnospiraceae bacterium]MBQ6575759.1 FAD-dependent oxidoreductase [Lachnospiraceae bacterium]MBR4575408.1 FAD-dependent oxidoreductase [Lachnospiraceae bacterium]
MKYLILGAGPSGLTFANMLLRSGEKDFLVLERDKTAGGLCRSTDVDKSPFDTGGGHFLDVKDPAVTEFVFSYLPEDEWDLYERDSRIDLYGDMIGSPIEANIWQLPEDRQKRYLDAIGSAGCNTGLPKPEKFTDWIEWKLGSAIAEDYMLPYNRKMFGEDLDSLGTYWLEKLPNVSYEETKLSCANHRPYGTQPGHARFYYPKKYGYGEAFLRMADALGDRIRYNERVESIDYDKKTVNDAYHADRIIVTIPPVSVMRHTGLPEELAAGLDELKYSSIVTEYVPERLDTKAHWIYYPDPKLSYHRILVRHNFCPGSNGYWTETNLTRFDTDRADKAQSAYFINDFAYPLNTAGKPAIMKRYLEYTSSKDIIGLGRWGEWMHYNSDVVIKRAMDLAKELVV